MKTSLCLAAAAMVFTASSMAEEVKLGCVSDRVWLKDGMPPAMIVRFDEQLNTASLFATELGGLLAGENVAIRNDVIMFKIKVASGELGDVMITRTDGSLMLDVQRVPPLKGLAACRKERNRF